MDRFTVRRRLLRGSLSAPVVLTVASPSALAQTTFLACITRGGVGETPPAFAETIGVDDRAYRKSVEVFKFVKDSDPEDFYESGKLFALRETAPGEYDGTYDAIDGTENLQGISTPEGYTPTGPVGTRWKLVYFDENGVEIGWASVDNGGSPVSISCWTSFNGDPPH